MEPQVSSAALSRRSCRCVYSQGSYSLTSFFLRLSPCMKTLIFLSVLLEDCEMQQCEINTFFFWTWLNIWIINLSAVGWGVCSVVKVSIWSNLKYENNTLNHLKNCKSRRYYPNIYCNSPPEGNKDVSFKGLPSQQFALTWRHPGQNTGDSFRYAAEAPSYTSASITATNNNMWWS